MPPASITHRLGASAGRFKGTVGYGVAVLAVSAATVVSLSLQQYLHVEVLIGVFLAAIMVVATTVGRGPAIAAALLGWITYNYGIEEPRYVLQLRSIEDLVIVVLFISVGAVIGTLSERVRDAALRASAHARQLDELLQASRAFSEPTEAADLHATVGRSLSRACHGDVWLADEHGQLLFSTAPDRAPPPERLQDRAPPPERQQDRARTQTPEAHAGGAEHWRAQWLETGGQRLGSLVWAAPERREAQDQTDLAHIAVMADLAAPAMLRLREAEVRAEAVALVRTDALRTALLRSISHDFRTPLSSIMASATALIDYGVSFREETRNELLDNIVHEADRLNRFIGKVLDMMRIGGGALQPQLQAVLPAELVERSLEQVRRLWPSVVFEHPAGSAPAVMADPMLLETALLNVLENAARFSPPHGLVGVQLRAEAAAVLIGMTDEGPGVAEHQRETIFEAFRSLEPERQRSGLGLSIAKAFVEACGGRAWASAREDGRSGLSVWIRLPRQDLDLDLDQGLEQG